MLFSDLMIGDVIKYRNIILEITNINQCPYDFDNVDVSLGGSYFLLCKPKNDLIHFEIIKLAKD